MDQLINTSNTPCSRKQIIEFDPCRDDKPEIVPYVAPWEWPKIVELLDKVITLSTKWKTTDSYLDEGKIAIESNAKEIYPYLPNSKKELKDIIKNTRKYIGRAQRRKTSKGWETIRPYFLPLKALDIAAAQKFAVNICLANSRNWDPRAYRLYQELQMNLGKLKRVHFITLTFSGNPTYKQIRKLLKNFTGNRLSRGGFESVNVVAYHPQPDESGRMHVHLIAWSKCKRTAQAEKKAITSILAGSSKAKTGIGFTDYKLVTGVKSFLKVFAYIAWNYSQTIQQQKGPDNPIPKGARVLSRPQNSLPGKKWSSVGKTTLLTPASAAWRKAVDRYANACSRSSSGNRQWVWRERRHVREHLEPNTWIECSVTGLDGYTYFVRALDVDSDRVLCYRLDSEDGRSYDLRIDALKELASLQIMPNALPKNNSLDFMTGKTAIDLDMLGMHNLKYLINPDAA